MFVSQSNPENMTVPRNWKLSTISIGEPLICSGATGDFSFRKLTIISSFLMRSVQSYCFRTGTPNSQLPVGTRTLRNSRVVGEFEKLNRGMAGDAVVGEEGVQEGWQDASLRGAVFRTMVDDRRLLSLTGWGRSTKKCRIQRQIGGCKGEANVDIF